MSGPEIDSSKLEEPRTQRVFPDNIGSHFVIGTLFGVGLARRPRTTLRVLLSKGPGAIAKGYQEFYKNTRPLISY